MFKSMVVVRFLTEPSPKSQFMLPPACKLPQPYLQ